LQIAVRAVVTCYCVNYRNIPGSWVLLPTKLIFCDCCRNLGHFLWCRNGKAFCEGPFTLHRQQLENYKQNVDVAPSGKISADAHVVEQEAIVAAITIALLIFHASDVLCTPGPVSNRFDRFLLIGPRAKGGLAPKGAPRSAYNQCILTLSIEVACVQCRRGSPVFFKLFWETKKLSTFSNALSKYSIKLALPPQSIKVPKTLIHKHLGIQMKQLRSLKMSLQPARSKLEKTLEGSAVFRKRGIPSPTKIQVNCTFLNALIKVL